MADLGNKAVRGDFVPLWKDESGVKQSVAFDDKGNMTIKMEQDLAPVLDGLHVQREANNGYNADKSMRRVAHIPDILRLHLINNEGWDPLDPNCQDRLVKLLNDPDYAYLRTAPGRLAVSNGKMR